MNLYSLQSKIQLPHPLNILSLLILLAILPIKDLKTKFNIKILFIVTARSFARSNIIIYMCKYSVSPLGPTVFRYSIYVFIVTFISMTPDEIKSDPCQNAINRNHHKMSFYKYVYRWHIVACAPFEVDNSLCVNMCFC